MIVRASEPSEYTEIGKLLDKAFKSHLERKIVARVTEEDPNFRKGDLRVVEAEGKIVSMMMIIRRPLRISTAIVEGAIVAPVATHPDFQGKGYCSGVMRNAIEYMKTEGFDLTILWGIPWLYPHYGYSPAMVKTELTMKPEQTGPSENVSYELRAFTEADLEEMTQIYHKNTDARTCAEIRSPEMWEWKPGGSKVKLEVFTGKRGEVIGYRSLGTDWGRPCAHEIGVLDDAACEIIFTSLLETAKKKDWKEFHCVIHLDHPFARFAFWHGCEIRIRSGSGAGMARVLNLTSLLTKMKKEFERRIHCSELHGLECRLKISSEESVFLDISCGRVSVSTDNVKGDYQLDMPLEHLNPLMTGYKGITELNTEPQVKVRGGKPALRLIEVLFPAGFPSGGLPPLVWE